MVVLSGGGGSYERGTLPLYAARVRRNMETRAPRLTILAALGLCGCARVGLALPHFFFFLHDSQA